MKKWFVVVVVLFVFATFSFAGNGGTAVPAGVGVWSGNCTATFVRSASGIVNETNRVCDQKGWPGYTEYPVWLQFRPENGTPNPECDPKGLVVDAYRNWVLPSEEQGIAKWFGQDAYNVCVYLVPTFKTGSVDSSNPAGETITNLPLTGKYRVCASGTWNNGNIHSADAEYTSPEVGDWSMYMDGYPYKGYNQPEQFADLMINGQFVYWGAYNANHNYCYDTQAPLNAGTSITLAVYDGPNDGAGNPLPADPAWYGDNDGSLGYSITYLGK